MDIVTSLTSPLLPVGGMLAALAAWLTLAVFNNIRDPGTNIHLIGVMIRMDLIKEDAKLGNGLEHRAINDPALARLLLHIVIVAQIVISIALWIAVLVTFAALWGSATPATAKAIGTLAILLFGALWVFFLCGGLWFGYWMKMPQVQQVHLSLFGITMLMLILIGQI